MREFAEQEIRIPTGPFEGRRFRCDRLPFNGVWFDEIDSGKWKRHVATGPTQSSKSMTCFIIPTLYHLFEVRESVICGLPDKNLVQDKWYRDLYPVIAASKYAIYLPQRGEGSRGGRIERGVEFTNGVTLRFMTGGGGDKSRASFTSRVLVVTETDGFDQSGGGSREADKITQLEARTSAYGDRARIYMECTLSFESGRTWQEYTKGTASKLVLPCPHCEEWVTPEREHLQGWRDAESVIEAKEKARFLCPACGAEWDNAQREQANAAPRLLHRGQSINEDGKVEGEVPATDTLGFRWSAVNNLLVTPGEIGAREWRASRSIDDENAEREMCQFVWALPAKKAALDDREITIEGLTAQIGPTGRGIVPDKAEHLTLAVDVGKWFLHWVALAWMPDATAIVVDYGVIETHAQAIGEERGILAGLRQARDMANEGWPKESAGKMKPDIALVDYGYKTEPVSEFILETEPRQGHAGVWRACKGYGAGQNRDATYRAPKRRSDMVVRLGDHYHIARLKEPKLWLVESSADHWKSWLHERIRTPVGEPGSFLLFSATAQEHMSYAKHLTAERQVEEFSAAKGRYIKWEVIRRNNHYLDASSLACVAGHLAGVRVIKRAEGAAGAIGRGQPVQAVIGAAAGSGMLGTRTGRAPARSNTSGWFNAARRRGASARRGR